MQSINHSTDFPLSIIIITLNEQHNVPRLLDDLCQQTYRNFEIIVVDSASSDKTLEVVESYADKLPLRTVVLDKRGTSLGRNTGAENAQHERLVFFDADVRISADFLENVVKQLQKRQLVIASARISSHDKDWRIRWGVKLFDMGMWMSQFFFPTCTGACIFSSKYVHQHIGGFNTRITLCEDCDYVNRASKTFRFRLLPIHFEFDVRRLKRDGIIKMGYVYLKANFLRLFKGELVNNEIDYPFGHYEEFSEQGSEKPSRDNNNKNN